MEYEVLGWPPDGPKLRLDHERFSYAGKFVMTSTGKAVARDASERAPTVGETDDDDGDGRGTTAAETRADAPIVAAVAFNADRTDSATCWLRYVTVRRDRRGEGIGPALVAFVRERVLAREFDRLKIAVNNPYAYEALHRAGFGFTGETTGIAELVLEHPPSADAPARYPDGLDRFADRDLDDDERTFLDERRDRGPPAPIGDA